MSRAATCPCTDPVPKTTTTDSVIRRMTSGPSFGAYPPVFRNETSIDTIHGRVVHDPYRWLEDPDSAETKAFVDAQNDLTRPYLKQCPIREK